MRSDVRRKDESQSQMTDSCRESSCVRALALDLNGRFIDGWIYSIPAYYEVACASQIPPTAVGGSFRYRPSRGRIRKEFSAALGVAGT